MVVFYTAVRCMLKTSRSEGEKRNTTWEANSLKIIAKQPIHKGWSKDRKYRVKDEAGETYLLRISDISQYEAKRFEFDMMQKVAVLGVPMCKPLEFGRSEEGVYSIQSWIDGVDAEEWIPMQPDSMQYAYGLEAGRILKKIHSIPAPKTQEDWEIRFNRKIDQKIKNYQECPLRYEKDQPFLDYIQENRDLLKDRPQAYQHGDYHIGNMMVDPAGRLQIIDFNRHDFGDPWEEFNRIVWCAQASPLFASGMVNGYFDGDVPLMFWKLLALYIASNTLSSLYWAIPFGPAEVNTMRKQAADILSWYDDMKTPVPSWYFSGYYLQELDGIPYKLKRPFDFSFLHEYGSVFRIYDDQDSGNICFGVEKEGKRFFVKFAGAPTERYDGDREDAIERLRQTVSIYQDLRHENLVNLRAACEVGGGFAAIFDWAEGDCMGKMYPEAHQRFMQLPVEDKLRVFRDIQNFFQHVMEQGYVGIDFYDGSILYDAKKKKTTLCDIDEFQKQPFYNNMGRMWGSTRFMSPEEFQRGAPIDEITNVYTLGATAFALFSESARTREAWPLSDRLYQVAIKAVSEDRAMRQQSIQQFREEWEEAL